MKYTRYILFLLVLVLATSCSIDEPSRGNNGKIQLVGRVLPFDELNVGTRAAVNPEEQRLYSLDYLIFAKIETDTTEWACVFYKHTKLDIIAIDRSLDFAALHENDKDLATLDECRIVILANYTGLQEKIAEWAGNELDLDAFVKDKVLYTAGGDTIYKKAEDFMSISTSVPALVGIPRTGLPRMGDFGRIVDLSMNSIDPITSGEPSEVTLTSLYAKMVFDISVNATQGNVPSGDDKNGDGFIDDVDGNKFIFSRYTVHNLAQTVDMNGGTESPAGGNGESDDATTVYENEIEGDLTNAITDNPYRTYFVCYLPERFLLADTAANEYPYPFSPDGADALLNPEDEKLLQRYKPKLAKDNATYVTFSGVFYNHQGHSYDVSYKIYVGNDNYGNFDVVRNRQYNNYITIRGIESSDDQSGNNNAVSIDHRVNVERSLPFIVSFRRETLLDSHFEIRPLRIRANMLHDLFKKNDNKIPKGLAVKVEIVSQDDKGDGNKWIGLERSYGGGADNKATNASYITGGYCDGSGELGASSAGKRKYFTTNLTISTLAGPGTFSDGYSTSGGQTVIVPVTKEGECVWVYVDECDHETEASTELDAVRTATIKVTYGTIDANTKAFTPSDISFDYVISQHLLFKIPSTNASGGYYYIEHEEEYLHNFDAEDNFEDNKTDFEGMEWGLEGAQLSFDHRAMYVEEPDWGWLQWFAKPFATLINYLIQDQSGNYDFYIQDIDNDAPSNAAFYSFAGWDFTKAIISDINNDTRETNTDYTIGALALDAKPRCAVEYCYNRNKRNANGFIDSINWYMPAIDEIQEIVTKAYIKFDVFQNKFYWSCQPAYNRNYVHFNYYLTANGVYMQDNINYARATRFNYTTGVYDESGMDGYVEVCYITGTGNNDFKILPLPDNRYPSLDLFTYHTGYKHRTNDKCRVRAVRRMN